MDGRGMGLVFMKACDDTDDGTYSKVKLDIT
jgi:hypothetical protein